MLGGVRECMFMRVRMISECWDVTNWRRKEKHKMPQITTSAAR